MGTKAICLFDVNFFFIPYLLLVSHFKYRFFFIYGFFLWSTVWEKSRFISLTNVSVLENVSSSYELENIERKWGVVTAKYFPPWLPRAKKLAMRKICKSKGVVSFFIGFGVSKQRQPFSSSWLFGSILLTHMHFSCPYVGLVTCILQGLWLYFGTPEHPHLACLEPPNSCFLLDLLKVWGIPLLWRVPPLWNIIVVLRDIK